MFRLNPGHSEPLEFSPANPVPVEPATLVESSPPSDGSSGPVPGLDSASADPRNSFFECGLRYTMKPPLHQFLLLILGLSNIANPKGLSQHCKLNG